MGQSTLVPSASLCIGHVQRRHLRPTPPRPHGSAALCRTLHRVRRLRLLTPLFVGGTLTVVDGYLPSSHHLTAAMPIDGGPPPSVSPPPQSAMAGEAEKRSHRDELTTAAYSTADLWHLSLPRHLLRVRQEGKAEAEAWEVVALLHDFTCGPCLRLQQRCIPGTIPGYPRTAGG